MGSKCFKNFKVTHRNWMKATDWRYENYGSSTLCFHMGYDGFCQEKWWLHIYIENFIPCIFRALKIKKATLIINITQLWDTCFPSSLDQQYYREKVVQVRDWRPRICELFETLFQLIWQEKGHDLLSKQKNQLNPSFLLLLPILWLNCRHS
jgi:hypothetical protein